MLAVGGEEEEGSCTLEEGLLNDSESVMHHEVAKVQMDIVRVRLTLQEELHAWAQRKLREDPGARYAVTGYVRQCLGNMEKNIDRWFAMAKSEIEQEWVERDPHIRQFCAGRS